MEIGIFIKQRRERLGLTQEDVARHCGIRRESVSQWEAGETAPARKRLRLLADVLKCKVDELTDDSSPRAPSIVEQFRALPEKEQQRILEGALERLPNHRVVPRLNGAPKKGRR